MLGLLPSAYGQTVSTVAGTGMAGNVNGPAAAAQFNQPYGVASDSAGNVYVAEPNHHLIRKISPQGMVSTLAGSGFPGHYNSPIGTDAIFSSPQEVIVAPNGDLLISDSSNGSIRRIDKNTAAVTTVAGTGSSGFLDGPVGQARFRTPVGLSVDQSGNLYVADADAYRLRKVAGGVVSTVAGSGVRGHLDGPAGNARFWGPTGLATDTSGNVYIADYVGNRIRKFDPLTNTVSTLAGNGTAGYVDGPLSMARLSRPLRLAYSTLENTLYVLEQGNNLVRKINLSTSTVSTVAGSGQPGFADGPSLTAQFDQPSGLALDGTGALLIGDTNNHRIRRVSGLVLATRAPTAQLALAPELWPNPSPGQSTLRYYLPTGGRVTYTLLDLAGRVVQHVPLGWQAAGWHTCPVSTPGAAAGAYLLRLRTPAGTGTCKLLVQ
ncbi:hypothetical protein GCM10023185_40170 [Hymenobacter saemangeumensis]|uniref:T9SS type A sorting domain-containing protein n=1 Tax=Hymenobacter saemangeumensis TaxID=1084522 RepID=A0ABP8IRG5_9BACT